MELRRPSDKGGVTGEARLLVGDGSISGTLMCKVGEMGVCMGKKEVRLAG